MSKDSYLKDDKFLKDLYGQHLKEFFAKVTILDWEERPIKDVEGIIIDGTITLTGNSAIRRSCNLTVFLDSEKYSGVTEVNNLFSLNKKARLEIGFKNNTDKYLSYDYFWFPLGYYVIADCTINSSLGGSSISLSLKDKMCLLNGEFGGVIPASTQFDEYDTLDENGSFVTIKPTIFQIIQELVHHFGQEQLPKIIISDLDTRIKKVMKWTGSSSLYLIKNSSGDYTLTMNEGDTIGKDKLEFKYGRDVGYIYTDFYYPAELICDAGSSICDVLDSIVQVLGNFEYFYDVDGNFRFQEKKNYLNTRQSKIELDKLKNEDYLIDTSNGKSVFQFNDSNLITSFSNTPQFSAIRNDFVIWGERKTIDDNTVPIRYHLAIDSRPKVGNTYEVVFWEDPEDGLLKAKVPIEFSSRNNFPEQGNPGTAYYAKDENRVYIWETDTKTPTYKAIDSPIQKVTTKDWRDELYLSGAVSASMGLSGNYYYTELENEWAKLYDSEKGQYYPNVLDTPSDIDFFLDFIDTGAEIDRFSISNIGRRTEVIIDESINCIFEPEIPDFVLIETGISGGDRDTNKLRAEAQNKGQSYIQVSPTIYALLATGGTRNSAYEAIKQMLHEYTSYNESISIQCLPIYHLEPNTRITVRDPKSDIYGDFMITDMTISLNASSTMSINATRALERI